jgi:hypothetical protein
MFITTLKHYPFGGSRSWHTSEGTAEESLAFLRGEEVTPSMVITALELDVSKFSPFTIIPTGSGSPSRRYSAGTLRRNFQLFDDFLTEFPEASSIELPYKLETIEKALSGLSHENRISKLSSCIDCVKYLNPKSSTYFLRFLLQDTPIHQLIEISESLTKQERLDILRSRRRREMDFPLPDEGMDHGILGAVLEEQNSMDTLKLLFPHSPSYWVAVACYKGHDSLVLELLVQQDFSQDTDWIPRRSNVTHSIQRTILNALVGEFNWDPTWEELTKILSMIGYHKQFSEDKLPVPAPFGMETFDRISNHMFENKIHTKRIAAFISAHSPTPLSVSQLMIMFGVGYNPSGGN